jgi:hypothetical protein
MEKRVDDPKNKKWGGLLNNRSPNTNYNSTEIITKDI